MCEILPHIEQDSLARAMYTSPWSVGFFANYSTPVKTYLCPSDGRNLFIVPAGNGALTSYLGVTGSDNDVNGIDSIAGALGFLRPARKTLLLDLRTLGIPLDNVEGMTIGPNLPDGRRSLVLVSDNNFAANQFTQFLLFALS